MVDYVASFFTFQFNLIFNLIIILSIFPLHINLTCVKIYKKLLVYFKETVHFSLLCILIFRDPQKVFYIV